MSRYIDAESLEPDTEWDDYEDGYISYSDYQIKCAETADVIEVVRCKDCKHHDEDYYTENGVCLIQFDCDGSRLIVTDNHYCGFGVKS